MVDYAQYGSTWHATDIAITVVDNLTDDPIATVEIESPAGAVRVMAEVSRAGSTLILRGLHLDGDGPSQFGPGNLRRLADAGMEWVGCDEIVIEGATRTTGANPGNRKIYRFKRRIFSAR